MADDMDKVIALATKIKDKAEDYMVRLEREMAIMDWKPEFRSIMWTAVADAAAQRAAKLDAHKN